MGDFPEPRLLVRGTREAVFQSAQLDFCASVDDSLRANAYSVWRIMKAPGSRSHRQTALTLFFLQLALNTLWSWLFFALNNPLAGLLDIVPQFLLIVATIVSFRRLDAAAALCLVPLAVWVAFASLLNFEIWRLNG
jgi:tryptophan-rich sensory protein